jgi:hypothetical protein
VAAEDALAAVVADGHQTLLRASASGSTFRAATATGSGFGSTLRGGRRRGVFVRLVVIGRSSGSRLYRIARTEGEPERFRRGS